MTEGLLTAEQVGELLAVPTSWVREATRANKLPVVKLGRYRRYDRADVLAWLQAQKAGGAAWGRHRPREGV